ncbi:MAG: polymer-forming cytoskeletal protein [Verrucomicrobia bacterium]|nr:polymer-forming cytoskeletal protein [Verrucomicrobiota bacterium]
MPPENSQTVIGKSVTIKGEITGSEPLIIEGTVEGRVQCDTSIMIRDSGLVKADLDAANLNIAGGVIGNISVKEKVEIVNGGYVVGDIRAPRIVINEGASVKGHIEMEVDPDKAATRRGQNGPAQPLVSAHLSDETKKPGSLSGLLGRK